MTTLYNKRKRAFILGKKEIKLRNSDVKLIFGIDCGEDSITTKSCAKPKDYELPFYKRRCKSVKRLDGNTGTVSTVNSSDHPTKKASQGHDQPQTPTKEDDKDKLISAMRAQMQDMEQQFMAELCKKEDQLKEMSTKKTGSPQQRSMVKRIKQKSRKQAHDPNFEYQPMTKAKEDTRNKTQIAADVPKPTEGTDEEKEKNNEKKKEEIETETEPAIEPEQKEDIGQEKAIAAETNPKEHANQEKTQLQVLESDDDFKEESIQNKPLAISGRKTNKQQHQLRWNKSLLSNQGNMLSSQECETVIASIEECPQQTPYS
ncbi:hypothetical protein HYC85_028234 [Camellia sinensis]|uniref:Uncharacterized protein n=1 Tax=Camellia sinensis TaxID=4442 RepID=A0A7J7FUK1_CAMSI|nr:hypothetical protein HYC85_028234 [Camellia sinensis]